MARQAQEDQDPVGGIQMPPAPDSGLTGLGRCLLGFVGSRRSEVPFVLTLCPPLFQGRAGSDGARGMPGQTGPKVGCHSRPLRVLTTVVAVLMLVMWTTRCL